MPSKKRIKKPKSAVDNLIKFIREGSTLEEAGWCISQSPEVIDEWMTQERIRVRITTELALFRHSLLKSVNKGGPGFHKSRSAFEILRHTDPRFQQRTRVLIESEVVKVINNLEEKLDEQTFQKVLAVIKETK